MNLFLAILLKNFEEKDSNIDKAQDDQLNENDKENKDQNVL